MTTAIIFGRFRILHAGHTAMIEHAVRNYDHVIIGVSSSSAACRSDELLRSLYPNCEVITTSNPFSLMKEVYDETLSQVFIAGEDRSRMLDQLRKYYPELQTVELQRTPDQPSSTACRLLLFNNNLQDSPRALLEAGLALNYAQALTIIAQYYLDIR